MEELYNAVLEFGPQVASMMYPGYGVIIDRIVKSIQSGQLDTEIIPTSYVINTKDLQKKSKNLKKTEEKKLPKSLLDDESLLSKWILQHGYEPEQHQTKITNDIIGKILAGPVIPEEFKKKANK